MPEQKQHDPHSSFGTQPAMPESLKIRMKESYDTIAETYAAEYTNAEEPLRLGYLKRLVSHLEGKNLNTASVLELGCGSGVPATSFLLKTKRPLFHVTGNDISTSQLNLARSALSSYADRLTLVESDMLSLAFSKNSFNAVTGFYSIIHLPREEQTQIMTMIYGWLKPGGFFLATFGVDDLPAHENERWMQHERGWMFWSSWGEEGSVKMVEDTGMELLTRDVHTDADGGSFVWILARKPEMA